MMPTTWWGVALVCAASAIPWIVASRKAKVEIILRRRFIKELFTGPQDKVAALSVPERQLLMLVGRVIGNRRTLFFQVPLIGITAVSETAPFAFFMVGFALLMGMRWFLLVAGVSGVPRDAERYAPSARRDARQGTVLVDVNVASFHQFGPDRAAQFWSVQEAQAWLTRLGFRAEGGRWVAGAVELAHLEASEFKILSDRAEGN